MSFHWPQLLWLLLVPAGLAALDLTRRRRAARAPHPKILRAIADPGGLALDSGAAAPPRSVRIRWRLWCGFALAVTALARPQWGRLEEPVFDQAREILIAVDLSRSMLAEDVKPSRLDRAKLLIVSLLEQLAGERVGLVVFSGTAFLQSPLSADYEILREFLPELNPSYLPEGGSNYTALIDTSLTAFGAAQSADRYLIVLSDGESTTDDWQQRIPALNEKGIRVVSLGIGTAAGAMIPDAAGGFVKDERGAVVLSRLGTATLQELAQKTGGVYTDASNWVDLAQVVEATVEQGRRGDFADVREVRLVERFQWLLAPALLFLLWSYWREFPVRPKARALKLAAPAAAPTPVRRTAAPAAAASALLIAAALLLPPPVSAQGEDAAATLAGPLSKLVAQLSSRDRLAARDYDELARTTLLFGQRVQGAGQPVPSGPVHDGIAAVDAGAALEPGLTDWAKLRADLEALLEHKDQQQQKDDNQESQEQQGDQDDQPNQENPKGGDQSKERKEADGEQKQSQGEGPPDDQQAKEETPPNPRGDSAFGDMEKQAPPPPPPQGDTQKIGGQPERRNEMAESPELAIPLQKLDQIRNQDSPAKLHQLMQDQKGRPTQQGRDW